MKELKVIQLLKTFSKEETKLFRKFAGSPYFNEGRNVLPLIDELLKYYPAFEEKKFSKKKVFEVIYSGEKYDESAADKQLSRAAKLAEKFLMQRAFEKQTFIKNILHTGEYKERKLHGFYREKLAITEIELSRDSVFELDHFSNHMLLETVRFDYLLKNKDVKIHNDNLLRRSDFVILDFINKYIYSKLDIHLLSYELNLDIKNSLTESTGGMIDLGGIVRLVKESGNKYSYVLEFKYYELKAMLEPKPENFQIYKKTVLEHLRKLTWQEKYNTLGALLSICLLGIRAGYGVLEEESVWVCEKMIDENSYAYAESDFTSITRYYNILITCIKYNRSDITDKLVSKFGSRLGDEHRESMINFSFMNKYFSEKNYLKALSYHAKIDYNHSLLKFSLRVLLLKIYYELGYTEEAESLIDASLKYFQGSPGISQRTMEQVIVLLKYVRRLIKMKEDGSIDKVEMLYEEIKNNDNINSKPWLVEKVLELMS